MRFFIMLLPWLELLTLIQLGIETSALTALLYVFLTFVAGIAVLRYQGMEMFTRLRETQQGRIFGQQLFLDMFIVTPRSCLRFARLSHVREAKAGSIDWVNLFRGAFSRIGGLARNQRDDVF